MCIFCVFWFLPFLTNANLFVFFALAGLFVISLFKPKVLPIFVGATLFTFLFKITYANPYSLLVTIPVIALFHKNMKKIYYKMFVEKTCSSTSNVFFSSSIVFVIAMFVGHGLFYFIPVNPYIKFLIMSLVSFFGYKYLH
ncbi:hypothetical protein [Candidatus Nesciobacter abundans]|uniref:Uncharacterized protein n=1 Tax=Candidatus Nesciobacter abundans TaxID=2601668 RepID=A0A5C0UFJ1_9PROT|nr:hypothetical protein [Candidatus Nesciobacter abundans]QEK38855.1 hypothetical protein FZC36_00145 [Candidatus Nesciobacter abundans]